MIKKNFAGVSTNEYQQHLYRSKTRGRQLLRQHPNSGAYSSIYGFYGSDFIRNSADYVYIDGGAGNDSISNSGSSVTIRGGAGSDTISSSGFSNVFQYFSGDGHDVITDYSPSNRLQIMDYSSYQTMVSDYDILISLRSGSVRLKNALGRSIQLSGGTNEGGFSTLENYITNSMPWSAITGTASRDTIINDGDHVTINSESGHDLIYNSGQYVWINGGSDNDSIVSNNTSYGGWYVTINGGAGNDTLSGSNVADVFLYASGDGNDLITDYDSSDTIKITDGSSYSTTSSGTDVIVNVGYGSMILQNAIDKTLNIVGGSLTSDGGGDTGTGGDNEPIPFYVMYNIIGNTSNTRITGTTDNDFVSNTGSNVTINSGGGRDYVLNYGANVIALTEYGDDYVINHGSNVTISTEYGDDYIVNRGSAVSIDAGPGHDTIKGSEGQSMTVYGGSGNDSIIGSSAADVFVFDNNGYGYDEIVGFDANDTIRVINGTTYRVGKFDNDAYVYIGAYGSVILRDAADKKLNVIGATLLDDSTLDNYRSNSTDEIFFDGTESADIINNEGANVTIRAGLGDDSIRNEGANVLIDGGAGVDTILNYNSNVTIDAGDGNDRVFVNTAYYASVNGGAGNDYIYGYSYGSYYNSTIRGGLGNDTINFGNTPVGGNNNVIEYASGDGNDLIYGFNSSDTIRLVDNATYSTQRSGSNVLVNVGSGTITLYAASSETINIERVNPVEAVSTIENSSNNVKVSGTDAAEVIVNGGSNVTIQANAGDDTIVGSDNGEMILVASNHGNDLIANFGKNDSIRCTAGSISTVRTVGNDAVVSLKGASYSATVTLLGAGDYNLNRSGVYLTVNDFNAIDNRTRYVFVNGSSGDDSIYNYAREVTIDAGNGNDTIETFGHSTSVFGGEGNDSIISTSGNNVTLHGGNGNDTLTGSSGSEVFQYRSDGGSDVITNYGENDTLHIAAGSFNSYYSSGSDLIVHAKGTSYQGYITLKGAASQAVKVKVGSGSVQTINDNRFNSISNKTRYLLVTGTSANDSIYNYAREVTINAGAGNDTVETYGERVSVFGGDGNDSLRSTGGNYVTLHGGNGNDTLTGSSGFEVFQYRSDGGADIITNFGTNDTLHIAAGNLNSYYSSGSDLIVHAKDASYQGYITLQGAASKAVKVKVGTGAVQTINNNTFNTLSNTSRYVLVTGTSANDSIYNYAREVTINSSGGNDTVQTYGNYVSVFGGNGNDSIKSTGGSGVTLHGGNGNDTLTGSSSAEVYQFRSDGGNDVITSFGTNDTLKVTAGSIQNYYASGSDYIVNVKGTSYSGTITLKNAKNVGTIKQSGNTIRLIECDPDFDPDTYEEEIKDDFSNPFATPAELVTRGSSQLPSTEEYWFERIDQVEDELNSILSTEDNSITFEINPNDRIKVNALEIVEASARSRNKK